MTSSAGPHLPVVNSTPLFPLVRHRSTSHARLVHCAVLNHTVFCCYVCFKQVSLLFKRLKVRKMCFLFIQRLPFTVLFMPMSRSTLPSGLLSACFVLYCGAALLAGRFFSFCVFEKFFFLFFIYSYCFFLRKCLFLPSFMEDIFSGRRTQDYRLVSPSCI